MDKVFASLTALSQGELLLLHPSSLRILEDIGLQVPNERMLAMLSGIGCRVTASQVRFPAALIEEMVQDLRAAAGPTQKNSLEPVTGSVSTQVFLVDDRLGTRRKGRLDDILKGIALTERLDHFPAPDAIVVPSDVPAQYADLMGYYAMFVYSAKPGGTYVTNPDMALPIIRMAEIAGRQAGFLLDTVSPLRVNPQSLEMALLFADHGMPVSFASLATAMTTAPVTAAGALALLNAEHLAGLMMLRLLGMKPRYYPGMVHAADPGSLLCSFGAPFIARTALACAQLARCYGLIPYGNIALTDALQPDFQAGFEKTLSFVLGMCAGVKAIGCQGIVGADQGISLEQLVIDNAWLSVWNDLVGGLEISEETIGLDAIRAAGIGGAFIDQEHTLRHYARELRRPGLFRCLGWDSARVPLLEQAHELVVQYTKGYQERAFVVDRHQKMALDAVVAEAGQGSLPLF